MTVTLHEVASRATVSIATASRALNGLPVAPENLARVRRAAAELGYVANAAARALRSERTQTMGLIFHDLSNLLGVELIDALSETVEEAGYSLLISTARGDAGRYDRLVRRFLERRVDALFCIAPAGACESLARYAASGVPVMSLFGRAGDFAKTPLMRPDFSQSAAALARRLHDLGHRHVALLPPDSRVGPFPAVEAALAASKMRIEQFGPAEDGALAEATQRLVSGDDRPTAAIATPPQARALIAAAIPGLSVVSVGGLAGAGRANDITALTVDPHLTGRAAGEAMLAWMDGAAPADSVRVQAGVLVAGQTLARAPTI